MSTLAELLAHETREGELYDVLPDGRLRCYACGPLLSAARGRDRRLQSALQRSRPADGAVGLRRRRAMRSDREEAVLSRASRRAGVQLRHARLRPALRLLPELGHVAGAARSGGGRLRRSKPRPRRSCATRCASARASWSARTTSRSSRANGPSPSSRKRRRPA